MSSLAPLSSMCALLGQSQELGGVGVERFARAGGLLSFGHGGVALSPFGVSRGRSLPERIGNGDRQRLFRIFVQSSDSSVEGEGESLVMSSRGRHFVFSVLSNSAALGIFAFTVAVVAMVSRNRRLQFITTPAESAQVYVVNEEQVSSPIQLLTPVSAVGNEVFPEPLSLLLDSVYGFSLQLCNRVVLGDVAFRELSDC